MQSREQRADKWLVVEGYMDVIALYQAGIYGAVASMGTAINESQISRLLTLNPTLTLSFDGDSAGQKAAWRTLEVALPVLGDDKELRFLTLPRTMTLIPLSKVRARTPCASKSPMPCRYRNISLLI